MCSVQGELGEKCSSDLAVSRSMATGDAASCSAISFHMDGVFSAFRVYFCSSFLVCGEGERERERGGSKEGKKEKKKKPRRKKKGKR